MAQIIRRPLSRRTLDHSVLNAVGVLFYAQSTQRRLFLMRADKKYFSTWGLVGGKVESNETLLAAITRECSEEIGSMPVYVKLLPVEQFTSPDNRFCYHTFICVVEHEFLPQLNSEHIGYAWCDRSQWPKPLHPGLWSTISADTIQSKIEQIEQTIYHTQ